MAKPGDPVIITHPGGITETIGGWAAHAQSIANEARNLIIDKYVRGQREHGGELWRKHGIIDMAIEEAVDQVIYLLTLRDQIADAGITLGDLSE